MYEFDKREKEFLQRFGQTGNGKELAYILKSIGARIDKTSSIPKGSDYGAEVEGRKLLAEMVEKILKAMAAKKVTNTQPEKGVDDFD